MRLLDVRLAGMGLTQQQKLDAWRAKKAAEQAAADAKVRGIHLPHCLSGWLCPAISGSVSSITNAMLIQSLCHCHPSSP